MTTNVESSLRGQLASARRLNTLTRHRLDRREFAALMGVESAVDVAAWVKDRLMARASVGDPLSNDIVRALTAWAGSGRWLGLARHARSSDREITAPAVKWARWSSDGFEGATAEVGRGHRRLLLKVRPRRAGYKWLAGVGRANGDGGIDWSLDAEGWGPDLEAAQRRCETVGRALLEMNDGQ